MRGSLIIIACFIVGVAFGHWGNLPSVLLDRELALYVLYVLMFLVGISIGQDKEAVQALKQQNLKILLLPLGTILGTLIGSAFVGLWLEHRSLTDCMAVGAGLGYYSLSSVLITQYKGVELGTIALVANVLRELIALLAAPWLVKFFGKLAPISVGGATTMDTTLPIITRYSGKDWVILAIFHGMVVDFSVPFLVTFFATI